MSEYTTLSFPYVGKDTGLAVQGIADDWTITAPIRIAQHLSNVWHATEPSSLVRSGASFSFLLNGVGIFPPLLQNHPMSLWAGLNDRNYSWLLFYGMDLCEEYFRRFGQKASTPYNHGISKMLKALESMPESLPEGEWSPPPVDKDLV